MKAKKPAGKSAKKSVNKSAKNHKSNGVKKYCEACQIIRNGSYNSPVKSQGNLVPHTCGKSEQQLKEFTFNMNILNGMRRRLTYGSEFDDS